MVCLLDLLSLLFLSDICVCVHLEKRRTEKPAVLVKATFLCALQCSICFPLRAVMADALASNTDGPKAGIKNLKTKPNARKEHNSSCFSISFAFYSQQMPFGEQK